MILLAAAPRLPQTGGGLDSARERARVMAAADRYVKERAVTVTSSTSPRSAGGPHDFFSEGDYWWPDPVDPSGPYVQKDGLSNSATFSDHRRALMRLSVQMPALTAAYTLTKDPKYAAAAARHARAWFVSRTTRMTPALRYAQAIQGRVTGRGTGIIDTIHLVEVARALERLDGAPGWSRDDAAVARRWFADYTDWLTTDQYGQDERDATNNHATCWVMQVAAFAHYSQNEPLLRDGRTRFKTTLVQQMAPDGSFPRELARTKPYGYSLFNLEAMATISQILSTPEDDLWAFELPDGRGMRKAMAYMVPYIRDRHTWPKPPDVMYDANWPMRQASLLFAGVALKQPDYIDLWSTLPADSDVEEVIRNFFVRQPLLWFE
ncbi:MAG: alginate lyase family protein [Vicinamibacterales bacterium]